MTPWQAACRARDLIAAAPEGLGGVWLRARAGPVRDAWLAGLPEGCRKLPPGVGDDALYGGVDLTATLAARRVVTSEGLLARAPFLVMPMAERCPAGLAGRLAAALDADPKLALFALDEAAEKEEGLPAALRCRLAFHIDLTGVSVRDLHETDVSSPGLVDSLPRAIAHIADTLGVVDLRALQFTLRAARASGSLTDTAALVLGPRATRLPEERSPEEQPEPQRGEGATEGGRKDDGPLEDQVIAAIRASLPDHVLDGLAGHAGAATGSGAGDVRRGNRRGRPLPPRRGTLRGEARVDVLATLRAAAPWQGLREGDGRIAIRPGDIRVKHYEEASDRLLIFVVDGSGSAAATRLAEAKGAVEILLARAYAKRDHVALIAFRGTGAELLLPPTRSLVQAKRRLGAMPGGGGTPLAAGLVEAATLADQARARGLTPTVALLTDGRANVALDGRPDKARAVAEAERAAARLHEVAAVFLDCGRRPNPALADLARRAQARYVPLPRAAARAVSEIVEGALA
ncbi:MAG: VWA domain-containing protein [Shimia sp.]